MEAMEERAVNGERRDERDVILQWGRVGGLSEAQAETDGLPPWSIEAFRQVISIVKAENFPCVFARRATLLSSGWVTFVDSIEQPAGCAKVRSAILAYFDVLARVPRERAIIMPLMVIVKPVHPMLSLKEYRRQAWDLFQYLHDNDPEAWPGDVPVDPERGDWSFCFAGVQLFANVSCPAHVAHTSRNLGQSLVFAMQPRTNFDVVGGDNPKGRQVRTEIRRRIERYEQRPVPAHLGFYGTTANREWLQMATPDTDDDPDFPAVCPFKFTHADRRRSE
jgi:FPC/CPF motif-containing protein YcgG